MEELEKKLLNSISGESLFSELNLYNLCSDLKADNWKISPSEYYLDPYDNKFREIDLVFRRTIENEKFDISIIIPVEIKSNNNFHILYFNNFEFERKIKYNCKVFGKSIREIQLNIIEKLNSLFIKNKIQNENIYKDFIQYLIESSNEYASHNIIEIPIFENLNLFSSFRETNTDKEKDLENSVFWKAYKSLDSFENSQLIFYKNKFIDQMLDELDLLYLYKGYQPGIENNFKSLIKKSKPHIYLFHKVVIIGSNIFEINAEKKIIKMEGARFIEVHNNTFNTYCDIINDNYVEKYFKNLLSSYDEYFRQKYDK